MPRRPHRNTAGLVFHVMNRGARRLLLFETATDYAIFLEVLKEATDRFPVRLFCYAVMPNHWHLVLLVEADGSLSAFLAWMTATHARRWHLAHNTTGTGTLYQGRYKAIAVKDDGHFLTVCRYVERNPVRARLVTSAESWKWSSAARSRPAVAPPLHEWPVPRPRDWRDLVNAPEVVADLQSLRRAIGRNTPFGPDAWRTETARRLGWHSGMHPRGRRPAQHLEGTAAESPIRVPSL